MQTDETPVSEPGLERRPYNTPVLVAEGSLEELTLIPTFILQSYSGL